VNSVKSSTVYCLVQVNFCIRGAAHNAVEIFKLCEKLCEEAQSFLIGVNYRHKWNYVCVCTMKPHDILK
jgi:hypothetical protein